MLEPAFYPLTNGPKLVIATEVNENCLQAVQERFAPLAAKHGMELLTYNPNTAEQSIYDFVMQATYHIGADNVVVSVPIAPVMAEAATLLNENGMLVFFAGVPNGTVALLDLSPVYLDNAQFTGTSGLTIEDQALVMHKSRASLAETAVVRPTSQNSALNFRTRLPVFDFAQTPSSRL